MGEIYYYNSDLVITHSDIRYGEEGFNNGEGDNLIDWLEGNIDLDPQFTDTTNGDFTLLPTSPCIDVGTSFFVWEGDTLVNMSEDEYNGNAPDMGAFESEFTAVIEFPKNIIGYYTSWSIYARGLLG